MEVPIALSNPVEAAFKVTFVWPEQRQVFLDMLRLGGVMITIGDLKRQLQIGELDPNALGVVLDLDEMRQAMRLWRKLSGRNI